jgi:hypothetical protein
VQVRAGFIGFTQARIRSIARALEDASDIVIEALEVRGPWSGDRPNGIGSIFINREIDERELNRWLDTIRDVSVDIPIVLVYGSEPDGKSHMLCNRFDCWLFSERDKIERTLTAADIGKALADGEPDSEFERRLFEVSLSAGPCSTGG